MSVRHVVLTREELDDLLRLVAGRLVDLSARSYPLSNALDDVLIEKDESEEFDRLNKLQAHLEEAEAVYARAQEHFTS